MVGDPATRSVELTRQAERKLEQVPGWQDFFRAVIDSLAEDPEPDGVTKFVAPADTGYSGCILLDVYPWRVFYQLAQPNRLVVVAIEIHPSRQRFL